MKWYIAKLVYQLWDTCTPNHTVFEEHYHLLGADDDFHAFCKARVWGERDAEKRRQLVCRFVDVTHLQTIDSVAKGTWQMPQRHYETNTAAYLHQAYKQAAALLEKTLNSSKKMATAFVLSTT
jgi:hypothetical protein